MTEPADLVLTLSRARGEQLQREATQWRLAHAAVSARREQLVRRLRRRAATVARLGGLSRTSPRQAPSTALPGTSRVPQPCC